MPSPNLPEEDRPPELTVRCADGLVVMPQIQEFRPLGRRERLRIGDIRYCYALQRLTGMVDQELRDYHATRGTIVKSTSTGVGQTLDHLVGNSLCCCAYRPIAEPETANPLPDIWAQITGATPILAGDVIVNTDDPGDTPETASLIGSRRFSSVGPSLTAESVTSMLPGRAIYRKTSSMSGEGLRARLLRPTNGKVRPQSPGNRHYSQPLSLP